jgi:tetratricopeptide (TPR) repeat protein
LTEALARYQTALRIKPDYADARCNAGLALFQLGRMQEAKRYFESALRLNPDDAQARDYLNRLQTLGPTPGN